MADRERRNGRMLFTDFDASDKGRPVAVFDEAAMAGPGMPDPVPAARQQTLAALAADLGLSFEDDGEAAERTPAPPPEQAEQPPEDTEQAEPKEQAPATPEPPAPGEDDQELLLDDAEALLHLPDALSAPAPGSAPSWDDLTSAYEQARPVEELAPFRSPAAASPAPAVPPSAAPEAAPGAALNDTDLVASAFRLIAPKAPPPLSEPEPEADSGDSVDVLSMLDVWIDHEQRQEQERQEQLSPSGAPGKKAPPLSAAPATPYGGIERIEDWFSPPENQPDPFARVEGWYAPPEEQADPDPVLRMEDWFEPPEEPEPPPAAEEAEAAEAPRQPELSDIPETPATPEDDDPSATKVDISWLSGFQNELPEGSYWRKKTRRFEKKNAETAEDGKPSPGDTMTMFSALDVDTLWDGKVASKQRAKPAPESDKRGMSGVFRSLDVDALWREKADEEHRYSLPEGAAFPGPPSAEEAEKTIIASLEELAAGAGAPDAAGTILLREDLLAPKAPVFRRSARMEASRAEDAPAPESRAREREGETRREADAPGQAAPAPATLPEAASAEPPSGSLPGGDAAARAEEELSERDALETLEALAASDDADFPGDAGTDPTRESDPVPPEESDAVIGDGASRDRFGEIGDQEYTPRTPPKKPVTTDDLLNDIDLDSLAEETGAETGDIAAPLIDDSAIDAIAPPRPPTAEMAAIAEEGGAEQEVAPDSVAVNPMDVFANMDDMDFSDDVDDEMRAMMEEEEGEGIDPGEVEAAKQAAAAKAAGEAAPAPATRLGKAGATAARVARRVLPMKLIDKVSGMIAWRENWWFYCDLAAALVASASLAVIISYLFWYRGT